MNKRHHSPRVGHLAAAIYVLALAAPSHGESKEGAEPTKPNIVFILADDLGWRDLGSFGSTFFQTPNIDRVAARGMRFFHAYAANPCCSPTRAGLLTGLYPQRTGFNAPVGHTSAEILKARLTGTGPAWARAEGVSSASRLDTKFTTYAKLLREAGYATAHFGKWHVGFPPYAPENHGFDLDIPRWNVPGPGHGYLYPWDMKDIPSFPGEAGEQLEERMGREVSQFIRQNKDRPFFVNYWAFTPHAPFDARPELVAKHAKRMDPANPQQCAVMAAMLESFDRAVGEIGRTLEEEGLAEKTIIVFTSDNGGNMYDRVGGVPPTSNAPLRSGKGTIYEGGVRVPLIVDWPGVVRPNSVSEAIVSTTDLFATFLQMAGVPLPGNYPGDGASLVPILEGKPTSGHQTFYCYYPQSDANTGNLSGASVRRGDDKLIRYFHDNPDGSDRLELYRLSDDPGEAKNLAQSNPGLAGELNELLSAQLIATDALVPGPNPAFDPNAPHPATVQALHGPVMLPSNMSDTPTTGIPGEVRLAGDWAVSVAGTSPANKTVEIPKPDIVTVTDEKCDTLPDFAAEHATTGWMKGLRLKGVSAAECTIKSALDPASLVVRGGPEDSAVTFRPGADYDADLEWGTVWRLPEGAIKADQPVWISYRYEKMRIDSIVLSADGGVLRKAGLPHIAMPEAPALAPGETRLANVFVTSRLQALTPDNLFPILETAYPEHPATGPSVAERLLPKTLEKLKSGAPLKILAWGDSVTGYKRFQTMFVDRLRAQYPAAKIELVTEAWGGHNTEHYLKEPPGSEHNYQEKVLARKPDLVISEFVNDVGLTEQQVEERYSLFLEDFKKPGAEWIILTPHYVRPDWMGLTRQHDIDEDPRSYVKGLRLFADKHHVALADAALRYGRLWRQGIPYLTLMENNINHPNVFGHTLFADSLMALFPRGR